MTDTRERLVDLNALLRLANVVVAGLVIVAATRVTDHPYMDARTIGLGLLLSLQTHLVLQVERIRRDPFVLLFAFATILFYSLRLFTLAFFPVSLVFDRLGFRPEDANAALGFILAANLCLYAGLLSVRMPDGRRIDASGWRATSPRAVIVLMVVAFSLAYFVAPESLPRPIRAAVVFVAPYIVVSMTLAYFLLFRRSLSRGVGLAIGGLLLLEIAAHALLGSRSTIVIFVQICILIGLAVLGSIQIPRRYVVLGVLLSPVLAVVMVALFAISTYNRIAVAVARGGAATSQLDVGLAVDAARRAGVEVLGQTASALVAPVFARAGFFDFAAEAMRHHDEYRAVVNAPAYARSIVDNVITPGLDVFDQPMVANSLRFVYETRGAAAKSSVVASYHSDQLTMYGELYVWMGWASLLLFFAIPYALKRLYVTLRSERPFVLAMKRAVVLFLFQKTLDGFGVDWVLLEMLPYVAAAALYSMFYATQRVAAAVPARDALAPGLAPG